MDNGINLNVDYILGSLYQIYTEAGGEFGVSLLVGGTWVTGMAIHGRAWFEQLAKVVDEAERGAEMGSIFRTIGRAAYPAESEVEAGEAEPVESNRPLGFIHLRDAKAVRDLDTMIPAVGGLLRVKFAAIDAWMLGNFGPEGYQPPPPPL